MKRREFFKKLGIGAGVAVCAPMAVRALVPEPTKKLYLVDVADIPENLSFDDFLRQHPMTEKEAFTTENFLSDEDFTGRIIQFKNGEYKSKSWYDKQLLSRHPMLKK